jgi:hypothetical protein
MLLHLIRFLLILNMPFFHSLSATLEGFGTNEARWVDHVKRTLRQSPEDLGPIVTKKTFHYGPVVLPNKHLSMNYTSTTHTGCFW